MKDSSKGQTLLEVILAIGVACIVLIGLTRAVTVALRNAQFAKNQALATQYAQEGMEKARQLRDQDPDVFWNKSGTETEDLGNFTREVTYDEIEGNKKMKIEVVVSWDSHKAEIVSFLTKWK